MPAEVLAPSNPVTWPQFFEAWPILVADFQSEYGIALEKAIRFESWRWFAYRASGLLSAPTSRIYRRFAPDDD